MYIIYIIELHGVFLKQLNCYFLYFSIVFFEKKNVRCIGPCRSAVRLSLLSRSSFLRERGLLTLKNEGNVGSRGSIINGEMMMEKTADSGTYLQILFKKGRVERILKRRESKEGIAMIHMAYI